MRMPSFFKRAKEVVAISDDSLRGLILEFQDIMESTGSSSHLLNLAIEDLDWERVSSKNDFFDPGEYNRRSIVKRARLFSIYDPLSVHTIRLWRVFVLGRGLTLKADDAFAQKTLEAFWNNPKNKSVFSFDGLRKNCEALFVDGELAFALFPGESYTIRRMDNTQITEVVTNPDDMNETVGYKRIYYTAKMKIHKLFYWDAYVSDKAKAAYTIPSGFVEQRAIIYFTTYNSRDKRGHSLLTTTMDWSKAYRNFMEARHAIQLAIAKFAWKKKVKGGPTAVAAAIAKHRSGLATGGSGQADNPSPPPGSIWVENMGVDLQPFKQETGAASAQVDSNTLLQIAGVGAGIPPHYYGAGQAAGNLSVSTNMELPLLKQFEEMQTLFEHVYVDLLKLNATLMNTPIQRQKFDVDFPDIVLKDVAKMMQAISTAVHTIPRLALSNEVQKLILTTLGIINPGEVVDALDKIQPNVLPEPPKTNEKQLAAAISRFDSIVELLEKANDQT